MACHLFGANPLSEPMMAYYLGYWEQISAKFLLKFKHYTLRIFPPAIDIIPTLLAVVYSNGKYTN